MKFIQSTLLIPFIFLMSTFIVPSSLYSQTQANVPIAISSQQYVKWVNTKGEILMKLVENRLNLSSETKRKIKTEFSKMSSSPIARRDLSAMTGKIITADAIALISKHLTADQMTKVRFFNSSN